MGQKLRARFAVYYYRDNGEIIAVVSRRDKKFERQFRKSLLLRAVLVTFTDELVHPDTHRMIYRRGDRVITRPLRAIRRRIRTAARRRRRLSRYSNRHLRIAMRSARAVYGRVLLELQKVPCEMVLPELKAWRAIRRIERRRTPSLEAWRAVLEYGVPSVHELFSPLHYLQGYRWTTREKRILQALGLVGNLARLINSARGARHLLTIAKFEKGGRGFPLLPAPAKMKDDPGWDALHAESCLFRIMKMRLRRCRYRKPHWFIAHGYHRRLYCPAHKSGLSRVR